MNTYIRCILTWLLVVAAYTGQGQVTANFTASTVAGCSPLVVNFTNTTTPSTSGVTFSWNLGLGGTPVPTVDASSSYISPGTYTVILTATAGGVTSTHSVTITVYPSPTVSFTAAPRVICPGAPVVFTSTSTPGVPGSMTYLWAFGDGGSGATSPVSHPYSAPGTYNVTLSVTNSDGCITSLMVPAYVTVNPVPAPSFTSPATHFCHPPGHAVFTSTTTGASPFTYTWRFGDGSPSTTTPSPSHDYSLTGTYTVTLIATDSRGCTDSIRVPADISVVNFAASFTGPDSVCVGSTASFINTSSAHTSTTWTFSDDGTSYFADPGVHTFGRPGTFTVHLTVSDIGCSDNATKSIIVMRGPAASFTQNPLHPCPPPTAVTFTGSVPTGTVVTWLYGDGGIGSGATATHTYGSPGIDTVRMISRDPVRGCIDTVIRVDTIYDLIPRIVASPTSGCKPLAVSFSASNWTSIPSIAGAVYPYPYPIASYSWNFGDGSPTSSSGTPSHTYTAVGTYHAVVTETTGNGCVVTDSVIINVGTPPVVTFTATPTRECYRNNSITFTATIISGPVDSFKWYFGDAPDPGTSTTPGTTHTYIGPGVYTVTVVPYYHGCPGAPFTRNRYITIDSPKSIPVASALCSPAYWVAFGDSSMGDDSHLWSFSDGTTSTLDNPLHNYGVAAVVSYTLTTANAASGCADTSFGSLDLRRPVPDFSASDTAICRDDHVTLTATISGGTFTGLLYFWLSPGGRPELGVPTSSPSITDTFHTVGRFTVTLIVEDQNGCLDTVTKPNYMLVAKPTGNFTASPTTGCWPLTVTFTDVSTDAVGAFMTSHAWSYGDGSVGTATTPASTHTFVAAGTFATTEIVTDNVGCMDTVTKALVTVWRPQALFNLSTATPCVNAPVTFTNTSIGGVTQHWSFGDGSTSTIPSPVHSYSVRGTYLVQLAITDAHGCVDTASYSIIVGGGSASFYMNDSVSICPPLSVHFVSTSAGATSYNWSLGDGSTSSSPSPSNIYILPKLDTIRLIITDVYGCKDTAYGHVNIFGYVGAFQYSPDSGCAPLFVRFTATTLNVPNILWDYGDGATSLVSYTGTSSHNYVVPGKYIPKLILSNGTGCKNSNIGLDTIKVDAIYPGFRTIPAPICLGDTFMLADTSWSFFSTITSHDWSINGNTSSIDSPSFYIAGAGTYPATLSVTDGMGCAGTVTTNVIIHPLPDIQASPDTTICIGDSATLYGYGGVSYTWIDAATLGCTACNPTHAKPPVVTTYTVTGTDEFGCVNTDTVTVSLRTKTTSVAHADTEICAGVPIELYDSFATKFSWSPPVGLSSTTISNPIVTLTATTKYTIIAQLASCIADTDYIVVYVHPLPTVDAGPDQTVLEGETAQLNATGTLIQSYLWTNAATLSCDSCASPVASMSVATTYTVTVSSNFGCKVSDTVRVHILCDKSQLFIPNSFTPNHDGQNDKFYPRGVGIRIIKSFRIYNRWGQVLFERTNIALNDASNAWDGSYMGDVPHPDVYVYVIDAICETGAPINVKGDVTIIR